MNIIMRVLLDTNIILYREDYRIIPANIAELSRILDELKYQTLIHPLSKQDILQDKDIDRQKISLSKIAAYNELEDPPESSSDKQFSHIVGKAKKQNDYIDNNLLYSLYRNAVNFLITEDQGIINKSEKLNLESKVFCVDDAIIYFKKFQKKEIINLIESFEQEYCYNLNLDEPIFNSLKNDYGTFSNWWQKNCERGTKAWIHKNDSRLEALLIYKTENKTEFSECIPPLQGDKLVKICTFIVSDGIKGNKVGERFLRMAIDYAIENNIYSIYLTHFIKREKDALIDLVSKFGFYKYGESRDGEGFFFKNLTVPTDIILSQEDKLNINQNFYPSIYVGSETNKYIIPIKPEYHTKLFPDYFDEASNNSRQLPLFKAQLKSEGNSIKKAYICNASTKTIKPSDIVIFYRLKDLQAITTVGTVEKVFTGVNDPDEIYRLVFKRTVFSYNEIVEIAQKPTIVILFYYHFHLRNHIKLNKAMEKGILKGVPQSITKIDNLRFKNIVKGELDERFIIH